MRQQGFQFLFQVGARRIAGLLPVRRRLEGWIAMGLGISYRGRLADLSRLEDFEDRLVDLALEVGGQARIWRSSNDSNPERMVGGVILNLAPGQESTSLLVSPDGWFIGLVDVEDAENGHLTEPPWCFVKTQYGPLEGHVALVEMFTVLKREFLADLEVVDEGGYWETRDCTELARRHAFLQKAIDGMAEGLKRHGLSAEAAEDSAILVRHLQRVAEKVRRTLQRPSEHPPVIFPDEDLTAGELDPQANEKLWDEMFKQNRRQQERFQRSVEERLGQRQDVSDVLQGAFEDQALELPGEEFLEEDAEAWPDDEAQLFSEPLGLADLEQDDPFGSERERHPLLQKASDLWVDLHKALRGADPGLQPALTALFQGAGDMSGGLAQALSQDRDGRGDNGLCLVQLKRALRGTAFARGALFLLQQCLPSEAWRELHARLSQMEKEVLTKLSQVRAQEREDLS